MVDVEVVGREGEQEGRLADQAQLGMGADGVWYASDVSKIFLAYSGSPASDRDMPAQVDASSPLDREPSMPASSTSRRSKR